jgi:hypothetical protein
MSETNQTIGAMIRIKTTLLFAAAMVFMGMTALADPVRPAASDLSLQLPNVTYESEITIELREGRNLVSLPVVPKDNGLRTLLAQVLDRLMLVQSADGKGFAPSAGIEDITEWMPGQAYEVFMASPATLTVSGQLIIPGSFQLSAARGWNLLAFPINASLNPADALASLGSRLRLLTDVDGRVYDPDRGVNEIGDLLPGQAYHAFLSESSSFHYRVPSTWIYPGENIQAKVDAHPVGTTFYIKTGVHRHQMVRPKDGNSFIGEQGAVLSGARLLTEFVREEPYWVATGQTQQGQVHGRCKTRLDGVSPEGCRYPEDLFIDDDVLLQVTTLDEMEVGKWFFDYETDKIYFLENPDGRKVETSVTRHAFHGDARGILIRDLIIEKYANPAQHGAIHGRLGTSGELSDGWVVENNVLRLNHGAGIRTGNRMRVLNNRIVFQGQIGIVGSGDDILIEGNEIAFNNTQEFHWGWEAGGTKWVRTHNLTVRRNHSHSNAGPGLWTDISNMRSLYEENLVENNANMGIFHEISYDAIIRNNIVRKNGHADRRWLWGSGILVAGSSNVEIYGNVVEDNGGGIGAVQQERGEGDYGPYKVRNLNVHGNTIRLLVGFSGVARDDGDDEVFSAAANNRFDDNTYFLETPTRSRFAWRGTQNWDGWRSFNQDPNGRLEIIR